MRRGLAMLVALGAVLPVAAVTGGPAVAAGAVGSGCTAPADLAAAGWSNDPAGTHLLCSYSTQGLTRTYWVYQPTTWTPTDSWPLVVVLHGCTEQGPDIAAISRFDAEAEQQHFLVVYPNQAGYTMTGTTSFDGNGSHCWNWFLPQGQARGAGEPALIAGITQTVIAADNVDPHRVDVIGVSAGGATADIMAATYPDLYAAAGILAGCEYQGLPCLGSAAELPPRVSGQLAYQASQGRARSVPFIVENGDTDPAVPVANAVEVTQQWQYTDDYATHRGSLSSPVASSPCAHQTVVPPSPIDTGQSPPAVENPYDVFYYSADGSACPTATRDPGAALGELWVVHGEFHAWPGGPPLTLGEPYTNPGGPDFTDAAWQFFAAHPCRIHAGVCAAGS